MAGTDPTPSPAPDPPDPSGPADARPFDTALRGYERRQVDRFVADRTAEIDRLLGELSEAQRQRRLATEHAEGTERELRELRAMTAAGGPATEDGFGYRAEKLLRMAEQEAAEARSNATRESASIIELARNDAEKHRHEVEQSLISRSTLLEQQAAQRVAELQEREQQVAQQLTAAREQADELHAAAVRSADRLREEAEAVAQEVRVRAETAAKRTSDQAAHELTRLVGLQSDVRGELARLAEMLVAELPGKQAGGARPAVARAAAAQQAAPPAPGEGPATAAPSPAPENGDQPGAHRRAAAR